MIPWIDECIDSIVDATVFSLLGANGGYGQIEIDEADLNNTAFTYYHRLLQFIQTPFGLLDAPETFHQPFEATLSAVR